MQRFEGWHTSDGQLGSRRQCEHPVQSVSAFMPRTSPTIRCCKHTTGTLFKLLFVIRSGTGSSVGIVTGYGLDGPGIESWWGRDILHLSRPALGTTQPPVQWVPGLSQG